jgi:uncharacterized membrane protein
MTVKTVCRANRRCDAMLGIELVIVGLAGFIVVTTVVIPHFAQNGYGYWDCSQLGDGLTGAVVGALTHPWRLVSLLVVPPVKAVTWLFLLLPLLALPLRSPYALVALPIMCERMLADRATLWTIHYHYTAPVWVILVLAAVDALSRFPIRWGARLKFLMTVCLIGTITVGMVLGLVTQSRSVTDVYPLARLVDGTTFALSPERAARAAALAQVPPQTCVMADDRMAGYLTRTNRVSVPGVSQRHQDFYLLDSTDTGLESTPANWTSPKLINRVEQLSYKYVVRFGKVTLNEAPDYTGPRPECGL